MPNMLAYDFCGVQPMSGPSGLIFALRPRYISQTGTEALFNEEYFVLSFCGWQHRFNRRARRSGWQCSDWF